MPNPEIVRYITAARAQGTPDETIKTQLISAGWPQADVEQAFTPQYPTAPAQIPQTAQPQNFPPQPPTVGGFGTPSSPQLNQMTPGSFNPTSQNTGTGSPIKLIILIIIAIVILVGGGFLAYNFFGKKGESNKETSKNTQTKNNSGNQSKASEVIFDIPSILNKNKADVEAKLGQPTKDESNIVTYDKGDYKLTVFFELDTNAFMYTDVYVSQPEEKIKDQKTIFNALNLVEGSANYNIELTKSSYDQAIIGVQIYPAGSPYYIPD